MKNREGVKVELEEWFRSLGIEKVAGTPSFSLSDPPLSLLEEAKDDHILISVQPAGLTAAQLSELFKLTNWAAAGLETVSQATVNVDKWFTTTASDTPPYLGESPENVWKIAAAERKSGMSLEQYLVFAARFKAAHGHFPDINYWTWLLESRERSLILFAGFDSHGNLQINSCTPDYRDENTGCRLISAGEK